MKILAIWITKRLFIFVVCIAEWNVCSNLGKIPTYNGNIDKITGTCIVVADADSSGTKPPTAGNRIMLLTDTYIINDKLIYGVQMAFGFGQNRIFIRQSNYNSNGGKYSNWVTIS